MFFDLKNAKLVKSTIVTKVRCISHGKIVLSKLVSETKNILINGRSFELFRMAIEPANNLLQLECHQCSTIPEKPGRVQSSCTYLPLTGFVSILQGSK